MKKIYIISALIVLVSSLSGCGWTKEKLGLTRHGPDAQNVQTRDELILPPEYSVRPKDLNVEQDEDDYFAQ
jgi:hypothetical protein